MCLYPKLIKNPKYKPNKKNGGVAPPLLDIRLKYVPVGCGNCIECRKQKANEWRTRLNIEFKYNKTTSYFVTLTLSEESLIKIISNTQIDESNETAIYAVRHFLERWRKKYKTSLKHWLITELGHNGTERIHLHGIIWTDKEPTEIEKYWKYGIVHIGEYCNNRTINYIVKYVTKIDREHKNYKSIILASPGIGKQYTNTIEFRNAKFDNKETDETCRLSDGTKINMPIYYRNKRYTEEEREKLWINKQEKKTIYILGIPYKVDTDEHIAEYQIALKEAQEKNKRLGYGDDSNEWKKQTYNTRLKKINKQIKKF